MAVDKPKSKAQQIREMREQHERQRRDQLMRGTTARMRSRTVGTVKAKAILPMGGKGKPRGRGG